MRANDLSEIVRKVEYLTVVVSGRIVERDGGGVGDSSVRRARNCGGEVVGGVELGRGVSVGLARDLGGIDGVGAVMLIGSDRQLIDSSRRKDVLIMPGIEKAAAVNAGGIPWPAHRGLSAEPFLTAVVRGPREGKNVAGVEIVIGFPGIDAVRCLGHSLRHKVIGSGGDRTVQEIRKGHDFQEHLAVGIDTIGGYTITRKGLASGRVLHHDQGVVLIHRLGKVSSSLESRRNCDLPNGIGKFQRPEFL